MKLRRAVLLVASLFVSLPLESYAGAISYVAIPSNQSDTNCGISRNHGYTTAVDGGNTRGTDRLLNGITLYALTGAGQNSATADNCTLNSLSGTLTDGGLTSKNIQADGTTRDVMSDMVFNNAGGDNSQVEIVLDPESLEQGSTYDLRVYVCPSSGQNRQVNLAFFGDGQNGVETGFFNEDDARTSAGGFATAAQVYSINYRYTWDGDSTPGITISQKFGGAPFCLYALTNELIEGEASTAAGGPQVAATDTGNAGAAGGELTADGDEGLSSGLVDQESDEVGVESDDFYGSESLNSHGRWVKLEKWGTCWQPTDVQSGWSPYTNGSWKECDDCGWTFVSDEPWAWACYHYGRWAKVGIGCGWAWVPGKVWAPSWVSWRQGRGESCNCIGWAPLPPEAGCELNVGVSSWVDSTCNIGPQFYTFINIRDFGADSYFGSGCIYDRSRNITIIIDTFNITNICWNRHVNIYCGGPDFNWCNTRIRQLGGKECGRIHVNHYSDPAHLGGKFARHEGEQLGLVSPRVRGTKHPKFKPQIAESAGADKIDHGWKGIKDKKQEQQVRNHISQETKGRNPRNAPAKLPEEVAQKLKQKRGGNGQNTNQNAPADGLHPGAKRGRKGTGQNVHAGNEQTGNQGQTGGTPDDQHPGKGKRRGKTAATGGNDTVGAGGASTGFDQHPGKRRKQGSKSDGGGVQSTAGNESAGDGQSGNGQPGRGKRHPGQSAKRGEKDRAGAGSAVTEGGQSGSEANTPAGGQQSGKPHDQGKGPARGADQQSVIGDAQGQNAGDQTKAEGTATRRRKGRKTNRQATSHSSQTKGGSEQQGQQTSSGPSAEGASGGAGHGKRQRQQQGNQANESTGAQTGAGHAGGKQQQKQLQQKEQQQQPQQQQQQQIQQHGQKGGSGGRGRHRQPPPSPPPG